MSIEVKPEVKVARVLEHLFSGEPIKLKGLAEDVYLSEDYLLYVVRECYHTGTKVTTERPIVLDIPLQQFLKRIAEMPYEDYIDIAFANALRGMRKKR